jgi:hypothetical protein
MTVLDYSGIRHTLLNQNINPNRFVISDAEYNLPSKDWVLNEFSNSFLSFLKFLGADEYASEKNDCDDFSRLAACLAQILHHRTSQEIKTGLAIGEFWYRIDSGGAHAINFIIYLDTTPKIMFYEPQTRKEVFLSETEKQSCSFWRL